MDDLIHIVSGMEVPDSIAADIETAHEKGQAAFSNFCQTRQLSGDKTLHDPIPKLKIKSFEDVDKTVLVQQKSKSKEYYIKAKHNLMARLIITGRARGISIDNLMQYSLGPVPMSLAYIDGSLMKTDKAKLLHYLEETVPNSKAEGIPEGLAWVIDAMEIIQKIPIGEILKTFGGLAKLYLEKIPPLQRRRKPL